MIYVYDLLNKKVVSKTQEKHFYAGGEYTDRIKIEFINADDITFAPMMAFKKANNREVSPLPANNTGVGFYEWKLSTMTGLLDVVGDLQFTLFITITNANGSKEVLNAITDVNRIDKAAMIPNSHIFVVGDNPDEIISDVLNAVENLNNTQSDTQNIVSGLVNANLVKSITNNGYVLKVVQHDGTESTIDLSQINANKNAIEGKLNKTDVVDDLNSDSSEKVLSAKQGKKLNNDLININNSLGNRITELTNRINAFYDVDDTDLDQLSEIVAYIKSNRELIELLEKQNYIVKTYNEIKLLKDNNKLIPHTKYVVSDYQTTTITEDTRAGETNFVLVITASSSNEFEVNAYAIRKNTTTNKVNLYSIKYCFDNDERFDWVDTINGKGVIFYMEDEYGNKAPYDFKTIQFKRYKITSVDYDYNNEFIGQYVGFVGCQFATIDVNDFRWCYTFQNEDSTEPSDAIDDGFPVVNNQIGIYNSGTNFKNQSLNNIVFYASNDIVEYYGISYAAREIKDNNIMGESHHITFGGDCTQNILGYCSRYNIIGRVFNHNNVGSNFEWCMIGSYARFNVIGEDFEYCVAGEYMMQNDIGTSCFRNILGDHFRMNKMSSTSAYNVFGSNCKSNVLIANCCNNIIGNNVLGCTFGNDARYSKIGDNICYSSIGSGARYVGLSNSSGDIKCNYHIMDNQQFEENNPKYYEVSENSNVRIELYFDGAWKIKGASTEQAIRELQAQAGEPISQTTTLNQITSQITAQDGTSVIGTINGNSRATNNLLALNDGTSQKSSVTIAIKNGVITTSGTPSNNGWIKIEEIKVPAGTYYYKDFGQSNTKLSLVNSSYQMQSFPTTYSSDTTLYLVINGSTINSTGNVTNAMPMLTKGSTAPSKFEPYFSGIKSATPTSITSVGKNLFDNSSEVTEYFFNASGVYTRATDGAKFIGNKIRWEYGNPMVVGYEYKAIQTPAFRFSEFDANGTFLGRYNYNASSNTITHNPRNVNCAYIDVRVNYDNVIGQIYNIMIARDGSTQYIPYQAESLTLKGSVVKRVGKVDLGRLDWSKDSSGRFNNYSHLVKANLDSNAKSNILCSMYDTDTNNNTYNNARDKIISSDGDGTISIRDRAYNDASELKSALSGVFLVYELPTPQAQEYDGNAMSTMTITSVGGYMGRQVFQGTITLPDCNATNTSSSAYNGITSNYGDVLKCDDLYNLNETAIGVYNNDGVRTLVVTVKDVTSNEALNEYLSAHPLVITYANTNSNNTELCLELASAGSVSDELVIPNNTLAVLNGGSIIQEGTDTPAKVEITYSLNLVQEVLNNAERDKDQEARIKQLEEQVKSLLQSIQ